MPGGKDVGERLAGLAGPLFVAWRHFGGNDDTTGAEFVFQRFADQAFAVPVAVRQRSIEERDPAVDGLAQGVASGVVSDAAPHIGAETPAAEAQLADDISRGAEGPSVSLHGFILDSFAGHSHAAPRTPLVSPCLARTTRVARGPETAPTASTWRGSSAVVASGRPGMFDRPPPSTTTSGSSTLISDARARPRRSW